MLIVEVEDTGVGIAEDEIGKLFSAFSQTSSGVKSQQGTGLGLAISREFVRLLGGELTVRSKVDVGTCFRFDIPVLVVDAEEARDSSVVTPKNVTGIQPGQKEHSLLVVDDSAVNRKLLVDLLSRVGFQVYEAANGREGIDIWRERNPSLIWMDLNMPVMDGIQAARTIKEGMDGSETVLIALTASAFDEEKEEVIEAGFDDFLRKPFKESEIFDRIHRHLNVEFVYEGGDSAGEPEEILQRIRAAGFDAPILVIDDLPINLRFAKKQLEAFGLECVTAGSGKEGLQLAQQNSYLIIFTDINMPEMDGYEFAHAYREWEAERGVRTPVLAMTANAMKEDVEACYEAGIDDVVTKPVTIESIAHKLFHWLPQDRMPDRAPPEKQAEEEEQTRDASQPGAEKPGVSESAPRADESPPVDFELLKDILGEDDEEGLLEMLDYFTEDFDGLMLEIERAFESEDRESLRDNAHTAKGGAGNAAAVPLSESMKELQLGALDRSWQDLQSAFDAARRQYEDVKRFIETMRNRE